jgi:hypothetical protein
MMQGSRRAVLAVSVVSILFIGAAGTYGLVGTHKSDGLGSAIESPRVETARLFSPPDAAPARDEIAATLAHEAAPAVWPQPDRPKRTKLVPLQPGEKGTEAVRKVPQNHKQRQAKRMPD